MIADNILGTDARNRLLSEEAVDADAHEKWPGWVRAIVIIGLSAALWGLIIFGISLIL